MMKNKWMIILTSVVVLLAIDAKIVEDKRKLQFKEAFGVTRPDPYAEQVFAVTSTVSNRIKIAADDAAAARTEADTFLQNASSLPEGTGEERIQKIRAYKAFEAKLASAQVQEKELYRLACLAEDGGLRHVAADAGAKSHFMYNLFRHPHPFANLFRLFIL